MSKNLISTTKIKFKGANDALADVKKNLAEMEKIADDEFDNREYDKSRNCVEIEIQTLQNRLRDLKSLFNDLILTIKKLSKKSK